MLLTTLPAIFVLFATPVFTSSTSMPTSIAEVIQATDFSHNTKSKHQLLSWIKQEIDPTEDIVMEQYNIWNYPVDIHDNIPETSIKQEINPAEFVVMDQSSAGGVSDEIPETSMETDTAKSDKVLCTHCGKLFANNKSLKQHMKLKVQCGECGKRFRAKSDLNQHMFMHTDDQSFTCHVCNKTYKRKDNMNVHIKQYHPDQVPPGKNSQMYTCSICEKQFAYLANLNNHMVTHTGLKPYTCTICGKSFGRVDSLKRHTKTHSKTSLHINVTNVVQAIQTLTASDTTSETQDQPTTVDSTDGLYHSVTVKYSGNKSTYRCKKCGTSYPNIENLRSHVRTVHAQRELHHSPMSTASDATSETQVQPMTVDSTDGLYHSVTEEHNDICLSDNIGHDTTIIKKETISTKQNSPKEFGQTSHRTIRCIHCGLSFKKHYDMEHHERNEHRQPELHRPTMSAAHVATSETLPISRQHTSTKSADDTSRNFIEKHIDTSRVDNFRRVPNAVIVNEEPMSTEQSSQGATIEEQVIRNINVEVSYPMTNEDQTRILAQSVRDAIVKKEPTWSEQSNERATIEDQVDDINVEVPNPRVIGDQTLILPAVRDAVKTMKNEVKE